MRKTIIIKFVIAETIWMFLVPIVVSWIVWQDIQNDYATGVRTTTDGDSIGLFFLSFFFLNFGAVLLLDLILSAGYFLYLRGRRRHGINVSV